MISLVFADDHPTTRAGVRAILGEAPDIQIVGEAEDGHQVQMLVEQLHPQILLLDLMMPGPKPVEIEAWVRAHCPETVTLILTAHDRDIYLSNMLDAGVSGYLTKNDSAVRLIDAIRRAAHGEKVFTKEQYERVHNWHELVGRKWDDLTGREQEVLRLLVLGMNNAAIADELGVKAKTIAQHVTNLLDKLGVNSRQEAVAWVYKYLSEYTE